MMRALYYGNICPAEDPISGSAEYRQRNRKVLESLNELEAKLTPEQMALVNQLHADINALQCFECEEKFKYGLTMGILLMQEASAGKYFPNH